MEIMDLRLKFKLSFYRYGLPILCIIEGGDNYN